MTKLSMQYIATQNLLNQHYATMYVQVINLQQEISVHIINHYYIIIVIIYTVSGKKGATLFLPVIPQNANRFFKFFHHHALQ